MLRAFPEFRSFRNSSLDSPPTLVQNEQCTELRNTESPFLFCISSDCLHIHLYIYCLEITHWSLQSLQISM